MASNMLLRSSGRLVSSCPWTQAAQKSLATSAVIKKKDYVMADPLDHATGLEKFELLAMKEGNDNPFDMYVIKPGAVAGSSRHPIMVPSTQSSRVVGCSCEHDFDQVVWFKLEKGPPQQCECGHYFKLVEHDPLDRSVSPLYGMGYGSGLSMFKY